MVKARYFRHLPTNIFKISRLAWRGQLIKMPIRLITDEFAFSLGPEGWNFYCALLEDYERNPNINLQKTQFWRFFQQEQIRSIRYLNDLLFLHDTQKRSPAKEFQFYLGTYPWGGLTKTDTLKGGIPFGWYYDQAEGKTTRDLWGYGRNLWYEPGDRYTLEVEWNLTIQLYHGLKQGYYPLLHFSFPMVTILMKRNGEKRGLILDGHHRLAVLTHLGYESVTVEVTDVVNEVEVEQWYYVKLGYCTPKQALEIFHGFFEINGRERIKYLESL